MEAQEQGKLGKTYKRQGDGIRREERVRNG